MISYSLLAFVAGVLLCGWLLDWGETPGAPPKPRTLSWSERCERAGGFPYAHGQLLCLRADLVVKVPPQ